MVNKYKRKSQQGSWSEDVMRKAIQEVTELKNAIKSTAIKYGIPRATLQRHLKTGSWMDSENQSLPLLHWTGFNAMIVKCGLIMLVHHIPE